MKEFIHKVLAGEQLSIEEASAAMGLIMNGQATPAQIGGFLVALKTKGETAQEVAGFVSAMRDHAVKIQLRDETAVDGCGTGGDHANTFNISTAASLVAAAAGATVAKHGNRSVSSKCGSADLLEACGGEIAPGPERVKAHIDDIGFGFMFAPSFHPSMKHAAGPRKELGVRTVFNILGPMSNPAGVKRQVIGVYDLRLIPLMIEALEIAGSEHVIVAHSYDGLDEFSVAGPTGYVELKNGQREAITLAPEDVGLERHPAEALVGGDAEANRRILGSIFEGQAGACRDAVVFNAGAMLYVAGKVESIADGVAKAQEAIDSGAARSKLDEWVAGSKA
jgi:anthranilate phosphoribosyltransferase